MVITLDPLPFGSDYSMKDIPIPSRKEYKCKLIAQGGKFINNLSWRIWHHLKKHEIEVNDGSQCSENESFLINGRKETYGFKTGNAGPMIPEIQDFEKKFWNLIKNIKFFDQPNPHQTKLRNDLNRLKELNKVIVFADKSNNKYCVSVSDYNHEIRNMITSTYKRVDSDKVKCSNLKSAHIAKSLDLEDRMEGHTPCNCFFTFKDHKSNFPCVISCRLIAPSKSDIGIISKNILQNIVMELNCKLNLNQWRDPEEVTQWFNETRCKRGASFLKFDIINFYPSIKKELLIKVLTFARSHIFINNSEMEIIFTARQSFLYHNDEPWVKIGSEDFDITMGSYDGAECCEIVGLYLLYNITQKSNGIFHKGCVGLYRDDGLAIVRGGSSEGERISKKLFKLFEKEELKITTEYGKTGTDYLNLYLDLKNDCYRQWKKPNNNPIYVNKNSSHPPNCLKQIPIGIEKMITRNCSSEDELNKVINEYQPSIDSSGYTHILKYNPEAKQCKKKRSRKRVVTWFNPPWSNSVKTNLAERFLSLVDEAGKKFKGTPLGYIFTRATIKISYGTTRNMKAHIAAHNKKILNTKIQPIPTVTTNQQNMKEKHIME